MTIKRLFLDDSRPIRTTEVAPGSDGLTITIPVVTEDVYTEEEFLRFLQLVLKSHVGPKAAPSSRSKCLIPTSKPGGISRFETCRRLARYWKWEVGQDKVNQWFAELTDAGLIGQGMAGLYIPSWELFCAYATRLGVTK